MGGGHILEGRGDHDGLGGQLGGGSVVQVSKLILGVVLAAHIGSSGGGIGDGGNWGGDSRGSSRYGEQQIWGAA